MIVPLDFFKNATCFKIFFNFMILKPSQSERFQTDMNLNNVIPSSHYGTITWMPKMFSIQYWSYSNKKRRDVDLSCMWINLL